MVAFTGPSAAMVSATIRHAIDRHNRWARELLRVRIGFSVG